MSDTIPVIATPETIPDIPITAQKGIPIEDIIEYKNKGLSNQEVADLVGCSKENVRNRLDACGYNPERLKNFSRNRADVFAHIQSQLLNSLSPDAINAMLPHHRVLSSAILYDKERLERGKSTANINVVEVQGTIVDLQRQAADLRKTL